MKISVITPSYNQAQYLEETIQSVLGQTHPDVELMVLDGGSTDGSVDILERYKGRLWYRSEKDNGQTAAINEGFKQATGDIVTWLNSDDLFYDESTLATVSSTFENDPELDAVFGDFTIIDTNSNLLSSRKMAPFDAKCLLYSYCFITPAIFIRRARLEKYGYLSEDFRYIFDWEYYYRLFKRGAKIGLVKAYLFRHRFHDASITVGTPEKQLREIAGFQSLYGNTISSKRIVGKLASGYFRIKRWFLGVILRGNMRLPFTDYRLRKAF